MDSTVAQGLPVIQFAVFENDAPAKDWPLVNAVILGSDDVGIEGDISFHGGCIICRNLGRNASALSLLYDTGEMGRLMLQTCLLPERDEPYLLSLELARHRIKTFIVKCEEWQMFDLSTSDPAMVAWEEARQLFTRALNTTEPAEADRLGRASLVRGLEATERLAALHADILLHRRFATRPASSTTLGVRIVPGKQPGAFSDVLEKEFDLVYLPINWKDLEPTEGRYDWDPLDRWMSWAQQKGKPVVAGPLIDLSAHAVPKWLYVWQHDYDTLRDLLYDHVEKIVQRYRSVVAVWSIASGLNTNENFVLSSAQMLDLTRMANLIVRQGTRRARTMLEIVQPFGEHVARTKDSLHALTYVDKIVQEGIRIDCFGVQVVFGQRKYGRATRDLMQFSSMLDKFFLLELPVLLTRASVPSEPVERDGGWWRDTWSAEQQAEWAARAFRIALSKPYVDSFFWGDLYDSERSDLPHCGLVNDDNRAKPAIKKLVEARRRMRKPLGPMPGAAELSERDEVGSTSGG